MMGFYLSFSLCCTFPLPPPPLVFTPSISLPSISNFLRIIRPSSEPGQWKTSLQTAPFTSRFSSQRTSSMSNLQVGRECEIKYTGCDLRCQLKVCVSVLFGCSRCYLDAWNNGMTPTKNIFSWPNLTGDFAQFVIVLSPVMIHNVKGDSVSI